MPRPVYADDEVEVSAAYECDRMRVVTFKIRESDLERLETLARSKGLTRSEAIRQAVELWIKLNESEPKYKLVRLEC